MQRNPLDKVLSQTLRLNNKNTNSLNVLSDKLKISDCQVCILYKNRGNSYNPVPGEGKGKIMFVGHKIGINEANSGQPSIGNKSQIGFDMFIESLCPDVTYNKKYSRDYVMEYAYVTNATRCGHQDSVKPSRTHMSRCSKLWLREEIRHIDPKIIVFWNKTAAESAIGGKVPEVGNVLQAKIYGKTRNYMVMNHPVVVHRDPSYLPVVKSQFDTLGRWLHTENLSSFKPEATVESSVKAKHHLVTTKEQYAQVIDYLMDKQWVAIDTETTISGKYGELSDYELDKGALMWHHPNFELVCAQLCSVDNGTVTDTYTIALGFKQSLTGVPQQTITYEEFAAETNRLLDHSPIVEGTPVYRNLCMWNAGFDCPVLTRYGVDLLGVAGKQKPFIIIDGQIIVARIDEHTSKTGQQGLDATSKRYLKESKGGGFNKHFNVINFPYSNLSDAEIREDVLNYTGEDPRKTLLCVFAALNHMSQHIDEIKENTSDYPSPVHQVGFSPFPVLNGSFTGSRLRDVAVSIDHQMIPIITEMQMIGFRLDTQRIKKLEAFYQENKRSLLSAVRKHYSWYNPQSAQHAKKILNNTVESLSKGLNKTFAAVRTVVSNPKVRADIIHNICDCFNITPSSIKAVNYNINSEVIINAYEDVYDELDAQQKTVEDKFFVYLEAGHSLVETYVNSLPAGQKPNLQGIFPYVDITKLKEFFSLVFLYKQLNKKWSTYFERFVNISDKDGKIHPDYKLTFTTSGRFSGNFQNIPRGGEEGTGILKEFDVREYINVLNAKELNEILASTNLKDINGNLMQCNEDEDLIGVFADFAAQEDRMAYALTGDKTKSILLSDPDLDTHFYNVAFCFGSAHGYDTSNPEGVMEAYNYFTSNKKKYKSMYRTPMKTVHYAKQYGAGDAKIHQLLAAVFTKQGQTWTTEQTTVLSKAYDELYRGVTDGRESLIDNLDEQPYVEYPIFGTIRHAKNLNGTVQKSEYLSTANAINQGSSAYMTKLSMLRLRHLIWENRFRWNLTQIGGDTHIGIILQVHDEIGVIAPRRLASEVAKVLESAMKIAVGPPQFSGDTKARYSNDILDSNGESGWLYIPDNAFKGVTLFDADAEAKITIAKPEFLQDGAPNEHKFKDLLEQYPDSKVKEEYPLIMGKLGHSNTLI